MKQADAIIKLILRHEAGYVNNPNDPGGPTNKGITLATFRRFLKPSGTIADLKNLSVAQAVAIYKKRYWSVILADDLPPGLDYSLMDFAVNSGPSRAVKKLQAILKVPVDGRMGPVTLAAVNATYVRDLIISLNESRLAYMKRIRGGKSWKIFGRGWARRVASVLDKSLIMFDQKAILGNSSVTQAQSQDLFEPFLVPHRPAPVLAKPARVPPNTSTWSRIFSIFSRGK